MTDADEELSAGRLGRTVGGRWRLEHVLGVGGMAAVYAARDPSGAVAAVKMLHPEMSVRREIRERFLREGYVANRVGHPGVVQALEHGDAGEEVFLAMELLAGETLRARVQRHGKLPVGEVLDYADQILDVLAVAHEKGIVHRDLKPDNLFVSPEGRIKILDFGLARVLDGVPSEHRTRTGVALGTLAYMAPEQALGRRAEIDGRVDLFALGATMFRVLSGRRVHDAESEAELLMAMASRPAPPLALVIPGISPAVAGVVDLALAFSRDARYPDARTMQGDVRALRQGQPGPYATARLSSREQATRADGAPAMSQRTQPLSATMPSHVPGTSNTMPMPAAGLAGGAAVPAGFAAQVSPASVRTAPLSAHPAGAYGMPGPAAFATTMPSTPAGPALAAQKAFANPVAAPSKKAPRGSLALVAVLGFAALAVAGGGAAWYYFAASPAPASVPAAAPAALPAAPATPAGSVAPPTPEKPPAVVGSSEASAHSPLRKSTVKKDPAAPGVSASAGVASPATTASASAAAPAPAEPAPAASVAPASPATAAPPPAPSPSAAPPAPATSNATPPPPARRGRGRGRND